jgi:hypothetical protein
MNDAYNIALWGPTRSGKTWLMKSFGKTLTRYTNKDPEFAYHIIDPEGHSLQLFKAPENEATINVDDIAWLFFRKPKINTGAHSISAHTHTIWLHDAPGSKLEELKDPVIVSGLRNADGVLILLDPNLLSSTRLSGQVQTQQDDLIAQLAQGGQGASTPSMDSGLYTQNEYTQITTKALELLSHSPREGRGVAICVTKMDLLGVQGRDPWQLIEAYFGQDMLMQLRSFQAHLLMETFAVSAAGFLESSGRQPNYDWENQALLAPDQWNPHNVEAPFFWMFEKIERQRLAKNSNGIVRSLFGKSRQKDYIPYVIRRS